MIAARQIAFGKAAGKGLSAKSYIQDGLVAMWDGIENAGWGTHDPNATTWKDLIEGAEIPNTNTWTDRGFYCHKNYYSLRTATISNSAQTALKAALLARSFTIEYGWIDDGTTYASLDNTGVVSPMSNLLGDSYLRFVGCYQNAFKSNPFLSTYGYYWDRQIFATGIQNGGYYRFVIDGGTTAYDINVRLYHDDSEVHGLLPTGGQTILGTWESRAGRFYNDATIEFFGNRNNITGTLYYCRLYSRALTAGEIAHNYNIDKARFGL